MTLDALDPLGTLSIKMLLMLLTLAFCGLRGVDTLWIFAVAFFFPGHGTGTGYQGYEVSGKILQHFHIKIQVLM